MTDDKVIDAFIQGHVATSKKLYSSGARLDGLWIGGGGIAAWDDGRVVVYDLGSKAAERVRKLLIRKLPRGLLHQNSVWALPMRTIRAEGYGRALRRKNSGHIFMSRYRPGDNVYVEPNDDRTASTYGRQGGEGTVKAVERNGRILVEFHDGVVANVAELHVRALSRRKNPRPAKTYEYLYVLQGYYAHGWEDLTAEKKQGAGVDLPAMRRLRTEKKNYQQNEGGQYRIIERREKIA